MLYLEYPRARAKGDEIMDKKLLYAVTLSFLIVVVVGFSAGAVPQLINFQGRLTNSEGVPVEGVKAMVFEFYGTEAGPDLLAGFSEAQDVTVTKGVFNVVVGSATPGGVPEVIFENASVYLSVTVEGEELTPRRQVVSAPYAYLASVADSAYYADEAGHAVDADNAGHAKDADSADYATEAGNADTVDGQHLSGLDARYVNVTGDTMSGKLDVNTGIECDSLTVNWDATVDRVLYVTPDDGIGGLIVGDVERFLYNLDIGTEGHLKADRSLYLGSSTYNGSIYAENTSGTTTFEVDGSTGDVTSSGLVSCDDLAVKWDATVDRVLYVTPDDGIGGLIVGDVERFLANLDIGTEGHLKADRSLYLGSSTYNGSIYAENTSGTTTFEVAGATGEVTTKGNVNTAAGKGVKLATQSGGVWSIYGSSAGGSKQLIFSGPSSGELSIDAPNATITLGGSTADTLKIPAIVKEGIYVQADSTGGANACAVRAENINADGIGITGRVTSSDACAVLINKGSGDILRGFSGSTGGDLVTQIDNNGYLRTVAIFTGPAGTAPPTVTAAGSTFYTGDGDITASEDLMSADDLVVGDNAYIDGDMHVAGTKNAVVKTESYGMRKVYADESAEVHLFDRGHGKLITGIAKIELDPVFLQTVTISEEVPMIVFASPMGRCKGLYVAETTDSYFVVKELGGGKSNAAFTWEVAAKRKGYENVRLPQPEIMK